MKCLIQNASIAGVAVFMMAASASAAGISYTTNSAGTLFATGNIGINNLTLDSSGGQASTLVFTPNASSASGFPSNIDLGDFLLTCTTCTTAQTTIYSGFTFDLVVFDTTDNATGEFEGTSSGGTVSSNSSTIDIDWSPLSLGPGTSNALTGSFKNTQFTTTIFTGIVAPNSGTPPGDTSVQGTVSSAPEPATFGLIGCGLLGFGLLRRKKNAI
jgi:hypothetical protein